MKKLIALIIVVAMFFALLITCPDKEEHQTKLKECFSSLATKKLMGDDDSSSDELTAFIGGILVSKITDTAIENTLTVDNYVIFSIGKMELGGKSSTVSFGILNQVFTPSEKQILDAIENIGRESGKE